MYLWSYFSISGIKVYRKFYNEEKERARGVLGIHVTHPNVSEQPVELLVNILNVRYS